MNHKISINNPKFASHFKSLNMAWLKKYFVVEPIDEEVLSHPEHLISAGGHVFYLLLKNEVVGCCALKHHGQGRFELTKMAVSETCQGQGLGNLLMDASIDHFKEIKGAFLYLETNSKLTPAINLYEKYGFVAKPCPFETPYQRSDYYMEWSDTNDHQNA